MLRGQTAGKQKLVRPAISGVTCCLIVALIAAREGFHFISASNSGDLVIAREHPALSVPVIANTAKMQPNCHAATFHFF
ncbi:MAG: hypothetical protein ABIU63_00405 [Chitinophagaceae bacterium]